MFSTQCQMTEAHLRHSAGSQKIYPTTEDIDHFDRIGDKKAFLESSNTSPTRRLQHPCTAQGGTIDGVEIDCVMGSSVQRVLQFSVFHDSRKAETLYANSSSPDDSAIGNVIVYDAAELYSVDMKSVKGQVEGTCTVVSTIPSAYCSFFYEIFADGKPDMSFTAEGRVDNSKIEGSTLTISGGYNGLEDSSGIVILTPASLDWGTDPPRAVPDSHLFDGFLTKFQVQLNYDILSSRGETPASDPES